MKALLEKIRKILRDRRTRKFLTRLVSGVAAVVVFITTYALVLPAITMESQAACGIEAHQHDDSCYTEELICGQEESEGHHHTEDCYTVTKDLVCSLEEHQHSAENGCYDEDGNLICKLEEHTHTDSCYEEHRELTCGLEETDGHHHTDSCYKKVLTCGKPVHTHSAACYKADPELQSAAVASTGMTSAAAMSDYSEEEYAQEESHDGSIGSQAFDEPEEIGAEEQNPGEEIIDEGSSSAETEDNQDANQDADIKDENADKEISDEGISQAETENDPVADLENDPVADLENDPVTDLENVNADDNSVVAESDDMNRNDDSESKDEKDEKADAFETGDTAFEESADEENLNTEDEDNDNNADREGEESASSFSTGFAAEEDEDSFIPEKEALDFNTVLNNKTGIYYHHLEAGETVEDSSAITDWIRVDEDTELSPEDLIRVYLGYTLPADAINATNDIARYRLPDTLHLTDEQIDAINKCENGISSQYVDYSKLEITDIERHAAYLGLESVEGTRTPDEELKEDSQEFISATVKAEKVYDEDDKYEGTDLIFTFSPYTVEKNAHSYDKDGQPTKAGEKVKGWLMLDFNLEQVDWTDDRTSEIVFAKEDEDNHIPEIRTVLRQTNPSEDEADDSAADGATEAAAEYATEEIAAEYATEEIAAEDMTAETSSTDATAEVANSDATGEAAAVDSTGEKAGEASTDGATTETAKNLSDDKTAQEKQTAASYPAAVFDDSITVRSGRLDTDLADTDLPRKTKMTVHVEADEGTFPEGTKMVLSPVEDLDAVAEAVGTAVDAKTRGFQAVDITFYDKDPSEEGAKEIEPLKPIRVSIKSDEIRKAAEDSSTAPVVVHIEDDNTATEIENTASKTDSAAIEIEKPGSEEGSIPSEIKTTDDNSAVQEKANDRGNNTTDTDVVEDTGDAELREDQIRENPNDETSKAVQDQNTTDADEISSAPAEDNNEDTNPNEDTTDSALKEDQNEEAGEAVLDQNTSETGHDSSAPEESNDAVDTDLEDPLVDNADVEADNASSEQDIAAAESREESIPEVTDVETADTVTDEESPAENTSETGNNSNDVPTDDSVNFEADSFSVYAIVYTVDFHYEVNGKMYEFSLPGGGFVKLEHIVEVLGIASVDENAENGAENAENSAENGDDSVGEVPGVDVSGKNAEGSVNTTADGEASLSEEFMTYEDAIKLNEVEVSEATKKFVADVESVEFSSPKLVWVGKIDEAATVGKIKENKGLEVEYSAELTEEQIAEINAQVVEAGDWCLISLQPFDTEEALTVTMKTGETFVIKVTDAKDAIVIDDDTREIQTIPNPSGTTITMFDYWLNTEDAYARLGWPGYTGNGIENGNNNWRYNGENNNRHGGDNAGINNGHRLKFVPGADNSATDYWVTGGTPGYTLNGRVNGINSWNGTWNNSPVYTGEPTTGIVAGALYNGNNVDENGYPRLNNALGGESLGYLFDPGNNSASSYRKTYSGVNDFLYVDSQGYYTYDSQYYRVSKLDGTTNSFTVSEQPADNGQEGYLGFWPMGMRNYWFGMHLQTPFSIPVDGRVLNPKGEYQPMQFEFAGDDDAWVYIDGILVADGGGIHNRTELDINFQTGEVLVRGGTYTSITNPNTSVYSQSTIYQKFLDAKNRGDITQAEWDAKYTNTSEKTVWVDTNNDGVFDTFAPGTKHTFDFFYLERGGAESNCYLRYNLITTTDFSAHKSYHSTDNPATTNVDESRLRRNQFKFELVGYDNLAYEEEGAEFVKAIMPDYITRDDSKEPGTFENPLFNTVQSSGTTAGYQSLIIGNTEDGNVNFGDKEISPSYAGKSYKYMVREVVPDNAVNPDNVRWADASEELRAEGGFVLDGIMYDSRVYYFIGTVVETAPGSNEYKLSKERFFDPDCTQPDPANFHSFVNGQEAPVSLKINKKSDTNAPLDGAVFSLTRAMQNADEKWVVREWRINNSETIYHSQPVTGTTSGGTLTFDNLTEGHYILEELQAPVGYQMGDQHRWLLTLEKVDATNKIQLVPYITPLDADGNTVGNRVPLDLPDENKTIEYEVLNGPLPPIDLSIKKQWNDNGDTSVPDDAQATFELHRIKTVPPVTVRLLDSQGEQVDEITACVGDTIKIYDTATDSEKAFKHHIPAPGYWQYVQGETSRTRSDTITPNDDGWRIQTETQYREGDWWSVVENGSTSTSIGQYTVKQEDVTAGVVKLRLSENYMASQTYGFDKLPKLYISGNASGSTTADEVISTFTLKAQNGDGDAGNPWKKSFNDLPLVDENGHPYSYYFKEVNHLPANFNVQTVEGNMGTSANPLTVSGDVVVTNNAPELPKITASKVWLDENGDPIDAGSGLDGLEVKLTLYKGTSEAPAAEVKTGVVTRTVTGNGTATWYLLDENADVSQYSVKETAVKIPGGEFITIDSSDPSNNAFGGTVTGDASVGFTVTNQLPKTEIEVTKQWKDGTSANADKVFEEAKTIDFSLYQKLGSNDGTPYEPEGQPVTGTVTYTPASGGTEASWSTETVSNLPKYVYSDGSWNEASYYPVEDPAIDGVTVTYQKTGGNATGTPSDAAVPSGTVTIINTDIVFPIRIVKVDADNPQTGLSGAKFQLTRKLSGEGSFTKFVHSSFEEDTDNDNKKTGLFTVSSTEGIILEGLLPGEYRIEEKKAPDGYIISLQPFTFTIDADGTVSTSDANSALVLHLDEEGDDPEGFQIGNTPGAALPNTGGPGTRLFTILGLILITGTGLLLWRRRRLI